MLKYYLPVLIVLLALAQSGYAQRELPSYTEDECFEFAEVKLLSDQGKVLNYQIEVTPPEINRMPNRFQYFRYFAAPLGSNLEAVLVDYHGVVTGEELEQAIHFTKEENPEGLTLPTSMAAIRIKYIDDFRGISLFRLEFELAGRCSLSQDSGTKSLLAVLNGLKFRLNLSGHEDTVLVNEPLDSYDPLLKQVVSPLVFNSQLLDKYLSQVPEIAHYEELKTWNGILENAFKAGPVLHCKVLKEGVYRIDRTTFADAGVSVDSIPVDQIQVYLDGKQIPVFAYEVKNNRFIDDASLFVYIPNDIKKLRPYRSFWITLGQEGSEPLRMTPQVLNPGAVPEVEGLAYIDKQIFEPNEYHHNIMRQAPNLRWGTRTVGNGTFEQIEFSLPEPASDKDGTIKIWAAASDPRQRGNFDVYINNELLGDVSVNSSRVTGKLMDIPSGILKEGVNYLTIDIPEAVDVKFPLDVFFLSAELKYPIYTKSVSVNLAHTLTLDEPTSMTLVYPGLDSKDRSTHFLLDVNNPYNPLMYSATRGREEQRCVYNAKTAESTLFRFTPEMALTPFMVGKVEQAPLFNRTDPIDLLMVTHSTLLDELGRLGRYRSRSKKVELVTTEAIYNEFSHGEMSFQAIADYIHHVFSSRKGSRLESVLLVGEGSESWWEYTLDRKDIAPNLVPVYGWQDPQNRVRSDDGYVSFSGTDGIPDAEVGRISVSTPEELAGVIDKIINYEQTPPAGNWRDRHVFFTDDEPEFIKVAKEVVGKTFHGPNVPVFYPLQDNVYENYFRGFWRKRSVVMSDLILDNLNHGARTITYLGHGGPNLWSGERIFHIRDIYKTANQGRAPILLAGSCDTGWVDYPMAPVNVSLSEHFLKHPTGGSIAAFIPVGATSSYEHNYILSGFYKALMDQPDWSLGSTALYAKLYYFLHRNNRYACEQYLLMGDPTLSVVPTNPFPNLKITPSELLEVTGREMVVKAEIPDLEWGTGTFKLFDDKFHLVYNDHFRVRNGVIDKAFTIPPYLSPGNHHLYISAGNEEQGVQYSRGVTLPVHKAQISVNWNRQSVEEELSAAGKPLVLSLEIKNDSSYPLMGASLDILHGQTMEVLGSTPLEVAANNKIERRFQSPIPREIGSLLVRVTVPEGQDTTNKITLAETVVVLSGSKGFARYVSVPTSAMEVLHGMPGDGTTFRFPVYNLTEKTLKNLSAVLGYYHDGQLTELDKQVAEEELNPEERTVFEFQTSREFTQGTATFILDLYGNESAQLPIQTEVFTTQFSEGVDLEIVDDSLFLENEKPFAGNTVFVRFQVKNNGDTAAQNIETELYLKAPWEKENLAPTALPWDSGNKLDILHPGQTHEFRLRWDPKDQSSGKEKLFATVKSSQIKAGTGDQEKTVYPFEVTLLQLPNLIVDSENVVLDRNYITPYLPVHLTIPIENKSQNDFLRDFRLGIYAITPSGSRRLVDRKLFSRMSAGEKALVQCDWIVQPMEYTLMVNLNEDREYLEETFSDNTYQVELPYVFTDHYFESPLKSWDFDEFPDFGSFRGIRLTFSKGLTIEDRPTALESNYPFHGEDLVMGSLGAEVEKDNKWGLSRGNIISRFDEFTQPIGFRIPLNPDDGTSYYDLYIDHVANRDKKQRSGHFEYRLEGDAEWNSNIPGESRKQLIRRLDTRDQFLDLEIREDQTLPSWNHLFQVVMAPIAGVYESPIIQYSTVPPALFLADYTIPARARIEFSLRYGNLEGKNIVWDSWMPVESGGLIPPCSSNTGVVQWKAHFYGSTEGNPVLNSVRFINQESKNTETGKEIAGLSQ